MKKNTIEINVNNYLSEDDMRQIAAEEFRSVARQKADKDFERILSNAAYELVRKEVDAVFDGRMVGVVKDKAVEVINGLSAFTVFKKPDAWDREASKAWVHLQAAMDEAQPLILAKVSQTMSEMSLDYLHEIISDRVSSAIIEKLTTKDQP